MRANMDIFDTAKDLLKEHGDDAKKFASDHADQIKAGVNKAAAVVDDKTDGKHSDKIESGVEKHEGLLDGLS